MPGTNGLELTKEARAMRPETKSIVLTAYSDFNYARQAVRYGATDFIMKNEFVHELPPAIKRASEAVNDLRVSQGSYSEICQLDSEDRDSMIACLLESIALSKYTNHPQLVTKYGLDKKVYCICNCEMSYDQEGQDHQNIMKTIESMLAITLRDYAYYVLNVKDNACMLIICAHGLEYMTTEGIADLCEKTQIMIREFTGVHIRFGISRIITDVNQLHVAYNQGVEALSRLMDSSHNVMVYPINNSTNRTKDNLYSPYASILT